MCIESLFEIEIKSKENLATVFSVLLVLHFTKYVYQNSFGEKNLSSNICLSNSMVLEKGYQCLISLLKTKKPQLAKCDAFVSVNFSKTLDCLNHEIFIVKLNSSS